MQTFLHFSLFHIGTAFLGVIGTLNTKVDVHYIETLVLQLKLGNVSRKAKKKRWYVITLLALDTAGM